MLRRSRQLLTVHHASHVEAAGGGHSRVNAGMIHRRLHSLRPMSVRLTIIRSPLVATCDDL